MSIRHKRPKQHQPMRKKGSVFVLSEQRNRDLLRAYNEQVKKQLHLFGRVIQTKLAEKVVNSPAARFWVSSERACVIIYRIEKGESIGYMKRSKLRFYRELYRAFCIYREQHPEITCVKHIVEEVVMLPAPCFPITARVARNIIEKTRRKCQREKIEQWRSK